MVINNVHVDIDAFLVHRHDHLFEFFDTDTTISCVSRIATFKSVIVKWVIAPVIIGFAHLGGIFAFINTGIIIEWLNLDVSDA